MKKISIILIGIFSFILVGCSNGDKKVDENKQSAKSNIVTNKSFSENTNDANSIENKDSELNDKTEVDNKVSNKDMVKKSLSEKQSVSTKKTNNTVRAVKSKSNTVKPSNKKNSLFKIGMSMNEVRAILKKNNIKIDNEIEVTSTTSDPAWGNKEFWTKNLTLQFDKKTNKLCLIEEVKESKMRTALGLVQGDAIEKMKKLYGNGYKVKSSDNKRTYTYKEKNGYFNVYEENGKVMWWSFSN
ncbi:putative lipoprotein [Clostridium botulinum C str. Eklund]|nr:putative lipoprotein [Clostridium botulinum C str. Eklund]NEZ49334.1 hypothetical protein [Clostridium botulinum]